MFRFLAYAFGWRDFESCKSCETLKEQLALSNAEKKELAATLLGLIQPKPVEVAQVNLEPVVPKTALWSRRRAALEEADRQHARTLKDSKFAAIPDNKLSGNKDDAESIAALEDELKLAEGRL